MGLGGSKAVLALPLLSLSLFRLHVHVRPLTAAQPQLSLSPLVTLRLSHICTPLMHPLFLSIFPPPLLTAGERMDLAGTSRTDQERHDELLGLLERKRKARTMAVPTNDEDVKLTLRRFGQPICTSAGPRTSPPGGEVAPYSPAHLPFPLPWSCMPQASLVRVRLIAATA